MQKKSRQLTTEQVELIFQKRQMVLITISKHFPEKQKEFLLFMAKLADPISNYDNLATIDLVDLFIEFEEENNEEELTQEIMNEVMKIYVEDFNEEEGN